MQDHGCDRDGGLAEFQRSSRRVLPEQRKQSQIWSHLRPERRYPEQFLLIFTVLPKGSKGSRRTPGGGLSRSDSLIRHPEETGIYRPPQEPGAVDGPLTICS